MAEGSKKSTIISHYEIEDAVEHLYDVTILGRTILTTVTEDPASVTEWIKAIEEDDNNTTIRYIGVEAELYTDDEYNICIGTFQMCDGKRCLVFQLVNCTKDDCPPTLEKFLGDENYGFFGIDIFSKIKMLGTLFPINPKIQMMDLGKIAMKRYERPELRHAEQSELVRTTLGFNVEKPEDVDHTQWGYPGNLSHVQVHYACLDAFLNLEVGRWLNADP